MEDQRNCFSRGSKCGFNQAKPFLKPFFKNLTATNSAETTIIS